MEIKFCRRCGTPLTAKGHGEFVCQNNHRLFYKSTIASNLMLVNDRNELLVGVRNFEPDKGCWDMPGGFCNYEEDFTDATKREALEELGLTPDDYEEPQYLMNGLDYYHWEGEKEPVINVVFWARLKGSPKITPADDMADCLWVPLSDVDLSKFAPTYFTITKAVPLLQKLLS